MGVLRRPPSTEAKNQGQDMMHRLMRRALPWAFLFLVAAGAVYVLVAEAFK